MTNRDVSYEFLLWCEEVVEETNWQIVWRELRQTEL